MPFSKLAVIVVLVIVAAALTIWIAGPFGWPASLFALSLALIARLYWTQR